MATSPINPTSPTGSAADSNSIISPANALTDQNTFLQLMISELENQDPTNPTDGTQFITQLAQFSSVASQTESSSDLDSMLALMQQAAAANAAANPPAATQGGTNGTNGTSGTNGTTGTSGTNSTSGT